MQVTYTSKYNLYPCPIAKNRLILILSSSSPKNVTGVREGLLLLLLLPLLVVVVVLVVISQSLIAKNAV